MISTVDSGGIREMKRWIYVGVAVVIVVGGFFGYRALRAARLAGRGPAVDTRRAAAGAAVVEARRALEDLKTSDAARAASQLALAQARQAYDKAQRRYVTQQKGNRGHQRTSNT